MVQIFILMIKTGFCVAKFINKHHGLPVCWTKLGIRKGLVSVFKILKLLVSQRIIAK